MENTENQLLIEPTFKLRGFVLNFKQRIFKKITNRELNKIPIQGKPFSYGIRVKNIGGNIFESAVIRNINVRSLQLTTLTHEPNKEFIVPVLNPDQSLDIDFGKLRTDMQGQVWFSFQLIPKKENLVIWTYQQGVDGEYEKYHINNTWGNSFIIRPIFEVNQESTNKLLAFLAVLTFIEGVWGLKASLIWFLGMLKLILEFFISLLP